MEARWLCLVCSVIFSTNTCSSEISDKRLCADPNCQDTISTARTTTRYVSTDPNMLSFTANQLISVKSKSSGSNPLLWGGELDGKHGYFAHEMVKEGKIYETKPQFTVPTKSVTLGLSPDLDDDTEIDETKEVVSETGTEVDPTDLDDTETENEMNQKDVQLETTKTADETEVKDETEITDETEVSQKDEAVDETELGDETDIEDGTELSEQAEKSDNAEKTEELKEDSSNEGGSTNHQPSDGVGMFDGILGNIGGMLGFGSKQTANGETIESGSDADSDDAVEEPADSIEAQAEALEKKRRLAKEEHLAQLRDSFLRRRADQTPDNSEVEELNDILNKQAEEGTDDENEDEEDEGEEEWEEEEGEEYTDEEEEDFFDDEDLVEQENEDEAESTTEQTKEDSTSEKPQEKTGEDDNDVAEETGGESDKSEENATGDGADGSDVETGTTPEPVVDTWDEMSDDDEESTGEEEPAGDVESTGTEGDEKQLENDQEIEADDGLKNVEQTEPENTEQKKNQIEAGENIKEEVEATKDVGDEEKEVQDLSDGSDEATDQATDKKEEQNIDNEEHKPGEQDESDRKLTEDLVGESVETKSTGDGELLASEQTVKNIEPTATQNEAHTEISGDETSIHGIDGTVTIIVDGTTLYEDATDIQPTGTADLDASIGMEVTTQAVEPTPALGDIASETINNQPVESLNQMSKPMEMTVTQLEPTAASSQEKLATVEADSPLENSQDQPSEFDPKNVNVTNDEVKDDLQQLIQPDDQYITADFVSRKPLEMMESDDEVLNTGSPVDDLQKAFGTPETKPEPPPMDKLDENNNVPDEDNNVPDENNNVSDGNNNLSDEVNSEKQLNQDGEFDPNERPVTDSLPDEPEKTEEDGAIPEVPDTQWQTEEKLSKEKMYEMMKDEGPSQWRDMKEGAIYIISFIEPPLKYILTWMPSSVCAFLEKEPSGMPPHYALLAFIFTCSLLACITFYQFFKQSGTPSKKNTMDLAATVHNLKVTSTERDQLMEKLQAANAQLIELGNRSSLTSSEANNIKKQLDTAKLHTNALQQQNTHKEEQLLQLRQNVDELTAFNESKDEEIENLNQRVTQMTEYTANIENQLVELQNTLSHSQVSLLEVQSQLQANTEEVTVLQQCKDQLLLEADEWSEQNGSLKKEMEELEETTKKYQDMVAFKENEIEVWKDCFKQLKILQDEVIENNTLEEDEAGEEGEGHTENEQVMTEKMQQKLQSMIDVANVNARLKAVEEENQTLMEKVRIETESRLEIEEQVQQFRYDAEAAKESQRRAELKEQESGTKLNVLQNYFQQKELEMQKELGEQQARQKDSVGLLENADSQSRMIKSEMESLRAQVDDLKKEIETSEKDHRKQLAANEKRVHENWLAARQAEREMKEAKSEAAMLRMKLVDMDRERELASPMAPPLLRPLPTRGGPPLPGMLNGPPRPPGPMMPPGPPFPGDRPGSQGGPLPMFADRPGSRGGPPGPPMFNDRPGSRGNHPGAPPPTGALSGPSPLREDSPLDRERIPPMENRDRMPPMHPDRVPFLPLDRPVPPGMRDRPLPPHMMDRDRPPHPMDRERPPHPMDRDRPPHPMDRDRPPHPMDRDRPPHPMDRDRPMPPDFRRPPSDLQGPVPPMPMDGRRSPPGPYPRDRRSPPPPHYRGPPPVRGPPPPSWRGPPPPDNRGPFPPDGPPGSYGVRNSHMPRTSSPRGHGNDSTSQPQSFV